LEIFGRTRNTRERQRQTEGTRPKTLEEHKKRIQKDWVSYVSLKQLIAYRRERKLMTLDE